MTPEGRIGENLLRVLRAGKGVMLDGALNENSVKAMRKTMRDIMSESYIDGSNACHKTMTEELPQPLTGEDARKLAKGMISILSAKGAKLEIPGLSDDEFTESLNRAAMEDES